MDVPPAVLHRVRPRGHGERRQGVRMVRMGVGIQCDPAAAVHMELLFGALSGSEADIVDVSIRDTNAALALRIRPRDWQPNSAPIMAEEVPDIEVRNAHNVRLAKATDLLVLYQELHAPHLSDEEQVEELLPLRMEVPLHRFGARPLHAIHGQPDVGISAVDAPPKAGDSVVIRTAADERRVCIWEVLRAMHLYNKGTDKEIIVTLLSGGVPLRRTLPLESRDGGGGRNGQAPVDGRRD